MDQLKIKKLGIIVGLLIFVALLLMPTPEGLTVIGQKVLAVSVLMVIWWSTDAIPLAMTSLLPLALFPLIGVTGKSGQNDISFYSSYSHWVVFMIMGVFFISAAIVKWDLHKRISLTIVKIFAGRPALIILGFMLSTATVSMWMSNTTATAMMIPVALALVDQLGERNKEVKDRMGKALVSSIPFAASIGGIGSIIGTGTNMAGIALIQEFTGMEISFTGWFKIGLPFVIIILPIIWFFMVKFFKVDKIDLNMTPDVIEDEIDKLGPVSKGERNVLIVFSITAILWITSELWGGYFPFISDENIAIIGALALFIMPVDWKKGEFTLDIKTAVRGVSWETLLLVGGSLAIGGVFASAGVAEWIGSYLGFLGNFPEFVIILILGVLCALLTEVATNMVVVTAFIPVIVGIAANLGISPILLMLTATISSSFAFMMPQGTPPNAIAIGSGALETKDLIKVGFWVKMICIATFPLILFGITVGVFGIR